MNELHSIQNPFRFSLGSFHVSVAIIAGTFGGCVALVNWVDGEFEIVRIDCGSGPEIVITAARSWEISQPIYYYVQVDDDVVVPTTYFDSNNPDNDPSTLRFRHFTAENGNLVGVTYSDDTSTYLIIQDFAETPHGLVANISTGLTN